MIHRKWSLLTGPPAILGGIVGAVVIAELLFGKTGDYLKSRPRKEEMASPNK